jgi:glycerol uptake facilitator-like aquaporin
MDLLFDELTNVYFDTTNPNITKSYANLFNEKVLKSILIHTILYVSCFFAFTTIFNIRISDRTYLRFTILLIILMGVGYVLRLSRARSIYRAAEERGLDAQSIINHGYFSFMFFG